MFNTWGAQVPSSLVWVCDGSVIAGLVAGYMLSLLIGPLSAYWVSMVALLVALFGWLAGWCM